MAVYRESQAKDRSGDVVGGVIQVNNEGEIRSDQGRGGGERLFEEMLRVSRASGWAFGKGVALSNLGGRPRALDCRAAHGFFGEALAPLEELAAERFGVELNARHAECLVFEGRYKEALEVATECCAAASRTPVGGLEALIERPLGYALHRPAGRRRPDPTSRRASASHGAERRVRVALTLRAMAATRGPPGEHLGRQSDAILERLGVVFVPPVPLP